MKVGLVRLKELALDLLFPPACFACRREGEFLCAGCAGTIPFLPPACFVCHRVVPLRRNLPPGRTCKGCQPRTPIYAFFSPYAYDHPVIREMIHALKYARIRGIAPQFAKILGHYLYYYQVPLPPDLLIVPVPLHKSRLRTRGFNQSELIARSLSMSISLSVVSDRVLKVKKTKPQVELGREERLRNVTNSFELIHPDLLHQRTILLLDDVCTTGATLEEVARVLKKAGARRVWAITVAR